MQYCPESRKPGDSIKTRRQLCAAWASFVCVTGLPGVTQGPTLIYFRNSSVVAAYCALRLFFNSSPALCRTCTQSQMCIRMYLRECSRQAAFLHQSNDAGMCMPYLSLFDLKISVNRHVQAEAAPLWASCLLEQR